MIKFKIFRSDYDASFNVRNILGQNPDANLFLFFLHKEKQTAQNHNTTIKMFSQK